MAKRRKKSQGGGAEGLIFGFFATAIVILVMIGSFVLFIAWYVYERKFKALPRPQSVSFFDHTEDEIEKMSFINRTLNRLYGRIDAMEDEGAHLSKRQDGFYNERSRKGKELNSEINSINPKIDENESSLAYYEALPEKRLNAWLFDRAITKALRLASTFYVVSFIYFANAEPKWVLQLSKELQSWSFLDFYSSHPIAYGASVGSLVVSLTILAVMFFYYRHTEKESLFATGASDSDGVTQHDASNREDQVILERVQEFLAGLPHRTLKDVADRHNIDADKRSKSSIVGAIISQPREIIVNIINDLAEE